MALVDWPEGLGPRGVAFNGRGRTIAGPPTLTGQSQVASLDAGYWVANYSRINAAGPTKVKAYRAFIAMIEGGAHEVRVPAFDGAQAPWPTAGGPDANLNADEPFSDGTLFTDGKGFFNPSIRIVLSAAAALRATQISVTVTTAGTISAGMYFSIGDRLYVIKEVVSVSGSAQTWRIWPPLREAAPNGSDCNFDRPVCKMRLETEASGDLMLDYGRVGFPDMNFIEVF